jgi:hypothetical protein
LEKLQNAQVDRRKSEKEICGVFLQSRNRKSHENERKIVPKVIIPEPPETSLSLGPKRVELCFWQMLTPATYSIHLPQPRKKLGDSTVPGTRLTSKSPY